MTPSELKCEHATRHPDSHFFDGATMRFFGDTLSNYGVRSTRIGPTEVWELYRKQAVRHGLKTSHWFAKDGLAEVDHAGDGQ